MKQQFLFGMSAWIFMWSFSLFLFLCSCEKPQVDTEAQPNPPKADSSYLAIEGIEVSNGQVIALGYNIVKFQGNFKKFQASSFSIVDYGYVMSSTTNKPTVENHDKITQEGPRTGAGAFESSISGLIDNKTYHARVYLKKESITTGNIEYSYHPYYITFKTKPGTPPVVKNLETNNITTTSFQLNALIEDENQLNITQHGHVWSKTNQVPDLINNDGLTSNGPLQAVFTHQFFSSVSGLSQNTDFFIRAYATNQYGTAYSPEITVRTAQEDGYVCLNGKCQYVSSGAEYSNIEMCQNLCCGAYVAQGVSKRFMCHNLGAMTSADPYVPSWEIVGGYWQWGQKEQAALGPSGPWLAQASSGSIVNWDVEIAPDGLWLDFPKQVNDPCPLGYKVPSKTQWDAVLNNNVQSEIGTWTDAATNYTSGCFLGPNLFLPAAGARDGFNGQLFDRGRVGYYWSSTSGNNSYGAWMLTFNFGDPFLLGYSREVGMSIRCIEE